MKYAAGTHPNSGTKDSRSHPWNRKNFLMVSRRRKEVRMKTAKISSDNIHFDENEYKKSVVTI